MIIGRTSQFTGKFNTMDLPVTNEQLNYWIESRIPIQEVFPNLTADQREFLITGSTQEEWNALFGDV